MLSTINLNRLHSGRFSGSLLLALFFVLMVAISGCDSSDSSSDEVTFEGRVIQSADRGGDNGEGVADARVTAWVYSGSGLQALPGEATTNAEGHFTLTTSGTAASVVLRAETDDMEASALVEPNVAVSGTVRVPPMTRKSTMQAEAYADARSSSNQVHAFDAIVYVDATTAAALEGGTTDIENVGDAVAASVDAEVAYATHAQGGGATDAQVQATLTTRTSAASQYRAALVAATTASARAQARAAFEEAYVTAYSQADLSYSAQAQAALTNARAAARFSGELSTESGFAASRQAQVLAAHSVALAVEQEFEAAGASQARLSALAQARASFVAAVRAAASAQAIAEAYASYRTAVSVELAGETALNTSVIQAAFAATTTARAALEGSVTAAVNVQVIAGAFVTFFTTVREATEVSFGLGVEGAWAARVVALLSVH